MDFWFAFDHVPVCLLDPTGSHSPTSFGFGAGAALSLPPHFALSQPLPRGLRVGREPCPTYGNKAVLRVVGAVEHAKMDQQEETRECGGVLRQEGLW